MNGFLDLVMARRSVRSFKKDVLRRADLELCTEAARYSPSACNTQPWKFLIVDEPGKVEKIKKTFSGLYSMNAFAIDAPAFIVITSEKQNMPAWLGGKLLRTDFRHIDIGIACEHVVLQAEELGIGTCILGWFSGSRIKKILDIPKNKNVELVVVMGYQGDKEPAERRLKEKSEVISVNKY